MRRFFRTTVRWIENALVLRVAAVARCLLAAVLMVFAVCQVAIAAEVSTSAPELPKDVPSGQQLFSANCSACHIGGNNVIISHKTLRKEALEKYEMNSIAAITNQVNNGKNAMPAFGGRLTDAEIAAVAQYVLQQADVDWGREEKLEAEKLEAEKIKDEG